MTTATPKPRAGEHTIERWNGWELERDDKGPFVQVRDYEALRAECDLLREALQMLQSSANCHLGKGGIMLPLEAAILRAGDVLAKHGR